MSVLKYSFSYHLFAQILFDFSFSLTFLTVMRSEGSNNLCLCSLQIFTALQKVRDCFYFTNSFS